MTFKTHLQEAIAGDPHDVLAIKKLLLLADKAIREKPVTLKSLKSKSDRIGEVSWEIDMTAPPNTFTLAPALASFTETRTFYTKTDKLRTIYFIGYLEDTALARYLIQYIHDGIILDWEASEEYDLTPAGKLFFAGAAYVRRRVDVVRESIAEITSARLMDSPALESTRMDKETQAFKRVSISGRVAQFKAEHPTAKG